MCPRSYWKFTTLFYVLMAAGCASSDNINPQSTLIQSNQLQLSQPKISSLAISTKWWRSFNDPQLDALMVMALQNSPSLKQAAARVREAQSTLGEADAANGPNLDLKASSNRQRVGNNVYQTTGYPASPLHYTSNSLGLSLDYELDWWGKYRNQVSAAKAQVDAARAEQAEAALMLTCSFASTYYMLQKNYALEELLQKESKDNQLLTNLRQQKFKAGIYGLNIPRQSQVEADSAAQQLLSVKSQIEKIKHQLAALAGRGPNAMQNLQFVSLPASDTLLSENELTVDILGKRPDITAQRQFVESYNQRVAIARKEFYPSLTIAAFSGLTTTDYGGTSPNILEAASVSWNVMPAISLPIFHSGALRSKLKAESALYDQAVESYNETIFNAVQETADALTEQHSTVQQLRQAEDTSRSMQQIWFITNAQYHAGIIGHDELLPVQIQLLERQQAVINARSNELQAKIGLIRALGGGYKAPTFKNAKA
ncbi:efflux transporter outer membrane subunit [Rahnella aquatilis]|nr:efflux transporter outer membrane subunit [Rahnella aquatilis]